MRDRSAIRRCRKAIKRVSLRSWCFKGIFAIFIGRIVQPMCAMDQLSLDWKRPNNKHFITKFGSVSRSIFKNVIVFSPTPNIEVHLAFAYASD